MQTAPMAQKLAVMFMRTDSRQGEGWEVAVQGRETFFHFTRWEGGLEVTKVLNRFGANGKSFPQAVLIQVSKVFPELWPPKENWSLTFKLREKMLYW